MPFFGLQRRIFDNAYREQGGICVTRPAWETDPSQYPIKTLPWGAFLPAEDSSTLTLSGAYVLTWTSGVISPINPTAGALSFNNQGSTTYSPQIVTASPPPGGQQYLDFDGGSDFLTTASITTTPQFRGENVGPYGARGYWGGWSGANTAGSTYAAKAGNGPNPLSSFFNLSYAHSDIDYLISTGSNAFRLLINHEALCPDPSAPAIPYAGAFTNASLYANYFNTYVKDLVDYIVITKGLTCILDFHNAESGMACYYNQPFRVTPAGGQADADILADAWARLATIFHVSNNTNYSRVWFGLHNEPNGSDTGAYTTTTWYAVAQACITAIRGSRGNYSTNKIVCPGLDYTAARAFVYNGSAAKHLTLTDSANNLGVQVHSYFDINNSGGGTALARTNPDFGTSITNNQSYNPKDTWAGAASDDEHVGAARIVDLVSWAETNLIEVYITEIGASVINESNVDQTTKLTNTMNNMFTYADAHPVYIKGWFWWWSGSTRGHQYNIDQYNVGSNIPSPMMAIWSPHKVSSLPIPVAPPAFNPYAATASNGRLEDILINYVIADALGTGAVTPANAAEIYSIPCKASLGFSTARNILRVSSNGLIYNTADTNFNSKPSMGPTAINQKLAAAAFDVTFAQPYTTYSYIYLPATMTVKAFFRTFNGNYDGSPGLTFASSTRAASIQVKTTSGQAVTGGSIAAGKHFVCCVYNGASSAIYVDNMTTAAATGTIDNNALTTVTYGAYGSAPPLWTAVDEFYMNGVDTVDERNAMKTWYQDSSRWGT